MLNSFFLFIMLLAFKHTHLISSFDVLPCIPLHLLSSCTFCYPLVRFDKPPCPTSLNNLLYPSHWQPPLTVPRQTLQPLSTKLQAISSFPTKLSHKSTYPTSSSLQSRFTIPLTAIRFEFLYPWILLPNTGNIPDKICPTLGCFVFFSRFLYFSTIAVVPSLSALFVPMCTSMDPPFPLPMICSTLSVTCSILAPGQHTTTGGTILSKTVKEKDLGVSINANMKVSEQCRIAASKGNQVLGMIRRNITYKEKNLIVPLYKAIVRPHLEYCIQAWSPYLRKDMLEKNTEESN